MAELKTMVSGVSVTADYAATEKEIQAYIDDNETDFIQFKMQILHGTEPLCIHRCNIRRIICLIIASFVFFGENKKRQE